MVNNAVLISVGGTGFIYSRVRISYKTVPRLYDYVDLHEVVNGLQVVHDTDIDPCPQCPKNGCCCLQYNTATCTAMPIAAQRCGTELSKCGENATCYLPGELYNQGIDLCIQFQWGAKLKPVTSIMT